MPTYEYECESCGHKFELYQSITDKPVRKCPECGKRKVNRLLGCGGGLIFKGSGFYQTDYRSKSYQEASKAETAKPESGTSSDTSGKSESGSGGTAKKEKSSVTTKE